MCVDVAFVDLPPVIMHISTLCPLAFMYSPHKFN